jgi:hypothetical protein
MNDKKQYIGKKNLKRASNAKKKLMRQMLESKAAEQEYEVNVTILIGSALLILSVVVNVGLVADKILGWM